MALLLAEAKLLSNNQLELGVIEEIVDKEDLFAILPFTGINGKAYVYNRELTLSEADFLDVSGTVNEGAATFSEVVTTLRILIGDVDVDKFMDGVLSDTNSQKAVQIAAKAKGLLRKFRRTLAIGDSSVTSQEFDGLARIALDITFGLGRMGGVTSAAASAGEDLTRTIYADGTKPVTATPAPTTGTAGAALTLAMLDKLLDAVPNGADAIFMPRSVIRAFRGLVRAAGGNTASEFMLPEFGKAMLTHNGVPILANDFIPVNETHGTSTANTTSAYAVRLNESDGLHGIYGGGTAGVVVEDIGTVQTKDSSRTRLKWYVGLALKSTLSLARLKGLTNVA